MTSILTKEGDVSAFYANMMSIYSYYSEYKNTIDNNCVKQAIEYNGEQNLDENTSYFQWRQQSDHVFESSKYNNISDSVSTTYPVNVRDLPQMSQEKMLSWYCTVPLRHDPHDYHTTPTIQEIQLNRKGTLRNDSTFWN